MVSVQVKQMVGVFAFNCIAIVCCIGCGTDDSDPLAFLPTYADGRYGFIDQRGEQVVAPSYKRIYPTGLRGCTAQLPNGKWLHREGTREKPLNVGDAFAVTWIGGNWYRCSFDRGSRIEKEVVRADGQLVLPRGLESDFGALSDGRLSVRDENDRWGYVNDHGDLVIQPQFEFVDTFSEGYAGVLVDRKWGFIDRQGKFVISAEFKAVGPFRDGLARVYDGKQMWHIDTTGKNRSDKKYAFVSDYSDGFASVKDDESGNWYYIDKQGDRAFSHEFGGTTKFKDGYALVDIKDEVVVIDRMGVIVARLAGVHLEGKEDRAINLGGGLFAVMADDLISYFNHNGERLWSAGDHAEELDNIFHLYDE